MSIRKPTDAEMLIAMRSYVAELEKQIAEHPGQVEQAYKEALAIGYTTGHKENQDMPFEWIEPFWLNSRAYALIHTGEKE